MSMLNAFTGGKSDAAEKAADEAYGAFAQVGVPTENQLTLPQLQQYVQAGLMTPEQAQAVLEQSNAYDDISTDPRSREASMDALAKLQSIGDAGGMDATEKANLGQIASKQNQQLQGQRASILDQMAQRGIPTSLMGVAQQLASAGQDSEQAHQDALSANSDASMRALQALQASGSLAGQIHSQDYGEQAQKAQAKNAIDQWNAANATTVNLNNAAMRQQATGYNTQEKQAVSNANVQNENARTQYNTALPQQVFNDKLARAAGESGASTAKAGLEQKQGEQNAGLYSGLIGAGATMMGGPVAGYVAQKATANDNNTAMMSQGGVVPGAAHTPGDSPKNDTVPAMLSPGEVVVPRSHAQTPQTAASFMKHMHRQTARSPIHPDDIKGVLHALTSMRNGGM